MEKKNEENTENAVEERGTKETCVSPKKVPLLDDHDIQILTENAMGLEEGPNALNKNDN